MKAIPFQTGDVIAEIETDKATMEVESINDGKIGKIFVPAGTESVKVNSRIAVILEDGEDSDAIADAPITTPEQSISQPSVEKRLQLLFLQHQLKIP